MLSPMNMLRRNLLAALAIIPVLFRRSAAAKPAAMKPKPVAEPYKWPSDEELYAKYPGLREEVAFERRVMPSGWTQCGDGKWIHTFLPIREPDPDGVPFIVRELKRLNMTKVDTPEDKRRHSETLRRRLAALPNHSSWPSLKGNDKG